MALTDKLTAIANAIRAKTGRSATMTLSEMPSEIASIPSGSDPVINPLSVTANGTYTAPSGVDGYSPVTVNVPAPTPTLQDKTITTNGTYSADEGYDGLGEVVVNVSGGGGGLEKIGTATTDPTAGTGYGQISIPANDGIFLLTNVSVTPNSTNRLPWVMIARIDTATSAQSGVAFQYNYGSYNFGTSAIRQSGGNIEIDGASAYRLNTSATYDLYKLY